MPAFTIESAVMDMLGGDEPLSRCAGMRASEVRRFQALWPVAETGERRRWLARLVERVEIDPAKDCIRVAVDEGALGEFTAGHSAP